MLVTANMLLSPACSYFVGELFCQLNTKLGHGILGMGGISDAVLLVVGLHSFPSKVLHPLSLQYSTPVFLPGESQGQRSLVGCSLWGRTESDMTNAT